MKKEIRIFFTALMFYTRIPCPKWVDHSDEYLQKSIRYFPLIGILVGGVSGLVFVAARFILPQSVSIILSMLAGILMTGAFHEDGLADVCDGFGGGWTKEKILLIMKDSRVGAYGVIGLALLFLIRYASFEELAAESAFHGFWVFIYVLIAGHSSSRFLASTLMYTLNYARDEETSKVKGATKQVTATELCVGAVLGLSPFFLFMNWTFLLVLVPMVLMRIYLGWYFKKWIGGYTGDCLGAAQQLMEIVFYLGFLVVWKFI
jgi:adenosylcobinamide-GDP ribazoletransferase